MKKFSNYRSSESFLGTKTAIFGKKKFIISISSARWLDYLSRVNIAMTLYLIIQTGALLNYNLLSLNFIRKCLYLFVVWYNHRIYIRRSAALNPLKKLVFKCIFQRIILSLACWEKRFDCLDEVLRMPAKFHNQKPLHNVSPLTHPRIIQDGLRHNQTSKSRLGWIFKFVEVQGGAKKQYTNHP